MKQHCTNCCSGRRRCMYMMECSTIAVRYGIINKKEYILPYNISNEYNETHHRIKQHDTNCYI